METELKEILFIFAITWVISTLISIAVLMFYWGIESWSIELTLIGCWNFGILGIILAIIFISIFLLRFKIIRRI